jgi:hypothetical protein
MNVLELARQSYAAIKANPPEPVVDPAPAPSSTGTGYEEYEGYEESPRAKRPDDSPDWLLPFIERDQELPPSSLVLWRPGCPGCGHCAPEPGQPILGPQALKAAQRRAARRERRGLETFTPDEPDE